MSDDARIARVPVSRPQEPLETVGPGFVARYALAYMSTCLLFLAPALVSLALKVNSLVGLDRAPNSLALVASIGALVAMVGNPFFGRLSDRTTWRWGRRRPWMVLGLTGGTVGIVVVALAPTVGVVLVGWCLAQLSFNALLAALVAVLPDRVPPAQRGLVGGILGVCLPVASVIGTFLVKVFEPNLLGMFLAPCVVGGIFIVLFAVTMTDPQQHLIDRPSWSLREFAATFYVSPHQHPSFAWAFASRFMFVLAYAFLTTRTRRALSAGASTFGVSCLSVAVHRRPHTSAKKGPSGAQPRQEVRQDASGPTRLGAPEETFPLVKWRRIRYPNS